MPILGSSNSAANKDMMSNIWINGETITVNQVLSAMILFTLLFANGLHRDFKNMHKFANRT